SVMALALRDSGLDIAESPCSKRDLARVQEQMNAWKAETGLPYAHLSRILAMSIGENHSAESLRQYMGE
ncbi:DNA-3-methyladenine glycosylase I, partial [Rhizobiaceae sp. 2RAB30]